MSSKFHLVLFCIAIFLWLAPNLPSFAEAQNQITQHWQHSENSPIGKMSYSAITLDNGLQVMLISRPYSGLLVNLAVGAGAVNDPQTTPGIAHFLEHMLFLGTKEYPEPAAVKSLFEANGGNVQAFTNLSMTTYSFFFADLKPEKGLAHVSAMFKSPLLDQRMIEKEVNAVQAEWLRFTESNRLPLEIVLANESKLDPGVNVFVWGNQETLKSGKGGVKAQLQAFFDQYYVAPNMTLVIQGDYSIGQLTEWAVQHFSGINAGDGSLLPLGQRENPFSLKLSQEFLQSGSANNVSSWQFSVPGFAVPGSEAATLVRRFFSSESEYFVFRHWLEKGWVENVGGAVVPSNMGQYTNWLVSLTLTESGKEVEDKLLQEFFTTLKLFSPEKVQMHLQEEPFEPLFLPISGAPLSGTLLYGDANQENANSLFPYSFLDFLKHINPASLNLWKSTSEPGDRSIKFVKGSYQVKPVSAQRQQIWHKAPDGIKLTIPNKKHDLSLDWFTDEIVETGLVELLKLNGFSAHLFSPNEQYNTISMRISAHDTPNSNNDVAAEFKWLYQLSNQFNKLRGEYCTGLQFQVGCEMEIDADLSVLLTFWFSEQEALTPVLGMLRDFNSAVASLADDVEQVANAPELDKWLATLPSFAQNRLRFIYETASQEIAATSAQHRNVPRQQQYLASRKTDISLLFSGGFVAEEVTKFSQQLYQIHDKTKLTSAVKLPVSQPWLDTQKVQRASESSGQPDQAAILYSKRLIAKTRGAETELFFRMLQKWLHTEAFNELRTQQQLGYIVSAGFEEFNGYPTVLIYVENYNASKQELDSAVDKLLSELSGRAEKLKIGYLSELKYEFEYSYNSYNAALSLVQGYADTLLTIDDFEDVLYDISATNTKIAFKKILSGETSTAWSTAYHRLGKQQ